MRSLSRKLQLAIALPALVAASLGLWLLWSATDKAVREATQREAVELSELVASSFSLVDPDFKSGDARTVHKAVTQAVRSQWAHQENISQLRILDRQGVVRWSRSVEEEDRPYEKAPTLLQLTERKVEFPSRALWPWSEAQGGQVAAPLGGVACAGCHLGEATMKAGVLQLTVEEQQLREQVSKGFVSALLALLAFAAALIIATTVAVRLLVTRRIRRLSAAMKRAEEGDFIARSNDDETDELGELSAAFNRMLARLTALKAEEIDHKREVDQARLELELKKQLEVTNHKLEGRVGELSILYEVAKAVTSSIDLNEVLTHITTTVPRRLGVPKFSIMLTASPNTLEVRMAFPTGSEGMQFQFGEGICGRVAATRKSVYVPELENDASFKVRGGQGAKGRGSLLALPILHGDELLGVLNFERPEKAAFGVEEIEFFTAVADHVAIAVNNARLHEQTVTLAITDPLTQVPNRRYLFQQLELEIARANRFGTQLSLLMIDIDHFKRLNDTAGHAAGDTVLRQVCNLMKERVRKVDTLARYGGEEFVVLLPQVTREEALEVADKLRAAVENAPLDHREVQPGAKITISVGVASLPIDATEQARLVDCADSALYASKRAGRNKVTAFAPGMEVHPGRERGPHATRRRITGEMPAIDPTRIKVQ